MTQPPGPQDPDVLKHYELIREIGRGVMGVVYEGRDRRDGSRVAVKVMRDYLLELDSSFAERFEREAHVAALLRSPHTVPLLDYGHDAGRYFLVMEFIEGESLGTLLARGPLAPERGLTIALEASRALEEAGARGVVHRDLKPDNIMLDRDGRVKVTDFGIARHAGSVGLTMPGTFTGTAGYAAPEQTEGSADSRADIYSLGAILYAMLAGRPAFDGATNNAILARQRSQPLPMGPLAHLPDSVANIVRRCMEKDPNDRYQSASELAAAPERGRRTLAEWQEEAGPAETPPAPAAPPPVFGSGDALPGTVVRPGPRPPSSGGRPAPPASRPAAAPAETPLVQPETRAPGIGNRGPGATAIRAPAVAPAAPGENRAVGAAPPATAPTPPGPGGPDGRNRRKLLVALGAGSAALIVAVAAAFALSGGDDGKKGATTPGPAASGTAETATAASGASAGATTSPPATPTATPPAASPTATTLPTVTPPAGSPSQLFSGARAQAANSPNCTVQMWAQPSEATTADYASNRVVRTLCNLDQVIVVTNTPPTSTTVTTEGFIWWRVLYEKGGEVGWVKEVRADGTGLRFLVQREYTVRTGDTCASIAAAHSVDVRRLTSANPTLDCAKPQLGQVLKIP